VIPGDAIATDITGNVIASGSFVGTTRVNFGGAPDGNDTFLVKLGP
jgi:hypothetical protein